MYSPPPRPPIHNMHWVTIYAIKLAIKVIVFIYIYINIYMTKWKRMH